MSYIIDLPQPVEARIESEAQKAGVSPAELVADLVRKNFGMSLDAEEQKHLNVASIVLLESWLAEAEKPRTPEEEADMKDLMESLNATRREAG